MFRRLYDWTLRAAEGPRALWVLALVSFSESTVLPLPVDAVAVPLMLASRRRVWLICAICTLTSVAGGAAGYAIGFFLYETLGQWLIDLYRMTAQFEAIQVQFDKIGWMVVIVGAITPLPYKLTAIACGLLAFGFPVFLALSLLGRGVRFFVIGAVLWWFGPPIRGFIDRNTTLVGWLVLATLIGGFALLWLVEGQPSTTG